MPAKINVIGERFGRLIVLADATPLAGRRRVLCQCDCGNDFHCDPRSLRRGHTQSCGCYHRQRVSEAALRAHTTHGKAGTPEYDSWVKMKSRCENDRNPKYSEYGGRGIRVCDRWRGSFDAFLADMGLRPAGANSVDRKDVNGHYEPDNCRWATAKEQARNKRNHRLVEWRGEMVPLSAACEAAGANYRSALYRLNAGLPWQPLPSPPQQPDPATLPGERE